ncbi:UNVERIFIED_CONTAM: hypothetical protein PYX00_005172 [Menopon gallinae]|uniref:RING-type E3 ubiquitin transferase n=1 Tax=Menopon gallinae TaxID=328185 RepID=A0AAW2HQC4_9NEOP
MATASTSGPSRKKEEKEKEDRTFECNICLDSAKDAVVSFCGHLFCWPCLHQWLEVTPKQICPVCKSDINRDKVVPLYGRGSTKQEDPRNKVPPRPAGQRTESDNNAFYGFGFGDGSIRMSLGIGAFPFAFFTSTFPYGDHRPTMSAGDTAQHESDRFIRTTFIFVAFIVLAWLLTA